MFFLSVLSILVLSIYFPLHTFLVIISYSNCIGNFRSCQRSQSQLSFELPSEGRSYDQIFIESWGHGELNTQ